MMEGSGAMSGDPSVKSIGSGPVQAFRSAKAGFLKYFILLAVSMTIPLLSGFLA